MIGYDLNNASRIREPAENTGTQQGRLPFRALADLDLGLFHCARTVDVRAVCSWRQRAHAALAVAGRRRHRCRGSFRPASRRGAAAVHLAIFRGQAESAVSPHLLHLRLERSAEFCCLESRGRFDSSHYRALVFETDLSLWIPAGVSDRDGLRLRGFAAESEILY